MGPIARDAVDEHPAPRLTCREVVELLSDYLEDGLPVGERARVEAHLATCQDCLAYLAQLRTTIGALGRLREQDVPRPMLARLTDAFRGWRGA
ncbi:MAG: zf-HC2 domain-containing protein [Solirubrobacteraceae bacterium]|nr:zf-HC2 domain-containing protein [Solirubrobacteraceae bacterium]